MTITYAQLFCTNNDLIADAQNTGVDEARMYQAIREACDYLQKQIGWFIPVTSTRRFNGKDLTELFISAPPLLSITSISDYGTALTDADYILKPDLGMWAYGPYSKLIADPESSLLTVWTGEVDAVEIVGTFGLYSRTGTTGATVADTTKQTSSQLTLKVSDGGRVSPGMLLLIGSEQELVTGWGDPSTAVTALNGALTASDEVVTVDDASLVNIGEVIRVGFEQMKVKDRNETTEKLSVARGWNGTGRVTHANDDAVDVYRTVSVERGVNGTTAAEHLNGVSISRYFAPDDVQLLAKKVATLIVNQAKGGYQGRTANQDLGVVFYHDIFVRDIETIKRNYALKVMS